MMIQGVQAVRPRDAVAYILAYNQYLRHAAKVMQLLHQVDYDQTHLQSWRKKCEEVHDRLARQAVCEDGWFLLPEFRRIGRFIVPHPALPMPITDAEREAVFADVPFVRVHFSSVPFIYGELLNF